MEVGIGCVPKETREPDAKGILSSASSERKDSQGEVETITPQFTAAEKNRARYLAYKLVPIGERCEDCGATGRLDRHHEDYAKPLEIQTLCRSCHKKRHLADIGKTLRVETRVPCLERGHLLTWEVMALLKIPRSEAIKLAHHVLPSGHHRYRTEHILEIMRERKEEGEKE